MSADAGDAARRARIESAVFRMAWSPPQVARKEALSLRRRVCAITRIKSTVWKLAQIKGVHLDRRGQHSHISIIIESLENPLDGPKVIRALGALAQEHRLAAYRQLVQAGPDGMAAGALAEALGVPASSMSFHLAQLANAGLVVQRRQSRSIIYSADYGAMNALMSYMTENCCGGAQCSSGSACDSTPTEAKDAA